jgi:hypothetical protein
MLDKSGRASDEGFLMLGKGIYTADEDEMGNAGSRTREAKTV